MALEVLQQDGKPEINRCPKFAAPKLELTNTIQYIRFVLFGFGKISCQEHAN